MGDRGPEPEFHPEDVLEVFEQQEDAHEPLTTTEVADRLECSRSTAYNLLGELNERGELESKKVGARGRVWWIPSSQS